MSAFPSEAPPPPSIVAAPPHSLEAEQSVLGAILLSDRTLYALIIEQGLRPEDFYRERHRIVYEAILQLYNESEPVDVLTVTEQLRSQGRLEDAGGPAAVDALAGAVPAVGNARRYAQIVRDHALMRRLLSTTYDIQSQVLNNTALPREIVEQAERAMFEVAHDEEAQQFKNVGDVLGAEIEKWQRLSNENRSITGTPSGFADLDAITAGFQPGNLVIIAARPSMGKCLGASALIYDPMSGARRRIDEVVTAHERGEEVWVVALGPDLRLQPARVSATFRNGVRRLYRVTTRLGRTIEATANHPLLTIEGWRRVDELRKGSRIGVPHSLPRCDGPTGSLARELAALTGALAEERQVGAAPALVGAAQSQHLATSDVWWDEIASIEPVGEHETYDLTVPGLHNFVADDLIVHNSALVTNIAENVALAREGARPVALFSLEMSEAELAQRFVASRASIKGDDLRKGRMKDERKWKRVLDVAEHFHRAPLYIDDSSDIGIMEIRAKARRLHAQTQAQGGLGLIIVDYLQLMRPDGRVESRVEQVGQMSRGLKILARELKVPVIALSQLSRGVESRNDKRPLLSDLRECVTGDTLVVLADGRRIPIRDLVGQTPEVVTVDERDRLVACRSDCVWPVGRRPVFTVRLASGRRLRATAEHRIRTGAGWSSVAGLSPGDRVALARRLPAPAEPLRWPDDHVVLLGQLIGDGSYLSGQPMRYTTASEENSAAVTQAAERGFGATVKRHMGRGSWHQLVLSGNGTRWKPERVNAWLRDLGIFGQRSAGKRVPQEAFRLADDQIALLLRHLWATDGCIFAGVRPDGRRTTRVYYATSSPGLAADVAALLLRLGIVARTTVTGAGAPAHHVVVSGVDAQRRFLDVVGAFGPRVAPAAALREAIASVLGATNVDTLPLEIWQTARRAMASRSISQRAMAAARGTSYGGTAHFAFAPSRETVRGYADLLEDPGLAQAAGSDLFWDRVVEVVAAGEEEVFDLTVPGPACWLADGIVSHNSGQIEQDADLVIFIYRDEYYNRDTTETPGEAELLISKHRNGGLGDVPLVFQGEYPRFMTKQPEA